MGDASPKGGASDRDEALVRRYTKELRDAGADMAAFDAVFDRLQADRRVRLGDLIAVSQRYSRRRRRPPTKTLALAEISSAFVAVVQEARKGACA